MPGRRFASALGLAAVLGLGACAGAESVATSAEPAAVPVTPFTPAPTAEPTDDPTAEAPTQHDPVAAGAVPEVIDEAYVEAVMAALDEHLAQVARHVGSVGALDEEFQARLAALYTPRTLDSQIRGWESIAMGKVTPESQAPITDVVEIVSASPDCVFFAAERDYTPTLHEPLDVVQPYWLKLVRREPDEANVTPWILDEDTWYRDGSRPRDLCLDP